LVKNPISKVENPLSYQILDVYHFFIDSWSYGTLCGRALVHMAPAPLFSIGPSYVDAIWLGSYSMGSSQSIATTPLSMTIVVGLSSHARPPSLLAKGHYNSAEKKRLRVRFVGSSNKFLMRPYWDDLGCHVVPCDFSMCQHSIVPYHQVTAPSAA
jgi:hypothetical protein